MKQDSVGTHACRIYLFTNPPLLSDIQNIDKDVPYFAKGVVSTAENLVIYMWKQMQKILPNPGLLYEIKCFETEKNIVSYRG
jgi:6-pyruvoyltetrahydropterin/6-carboxytetrahydropterin synthase